MKFIVFVLVLFFVACTHKSDFALNEEAEKEVLIELLNHFLHGASINDYETHAQFWADELIYTGSSGNRTTKENILMSIKNASPNPADENTIYHAENIKIQIYGSTAIVAFKLVATYPDERRAYFYNTGAFVKKEPHWQAVAWQATKIPVL